MKTTTAKMQKLLLENGILKNRLSECEDTLEAIRTGVVDALVVSDGQGEKIFTLQSVDHSYRVMTENMNEGAVTLDKKGIIVFTNKAFANLAKRDMSTLFGSWFDDFLPVAMRDRFSSFLQKCFIHPDRDEFSIIDVNGDAIPVSISGTCFQIDGNPNACLIISDIRERKEAERRVRVAFDVVEKKVVERTLELQQKEEAFRTLSENSPDSITRLDTDLRHVYVNPVAKKIVGMDITAKTWREAGFADTFLRFWEERVRKVIQTGKTELVDSDYQSPDGTSYYLTSRIVPEFDGEGAVTSVLIVSRDITERKKNEDALRESEARFRSVLDNSVDVVYRINVKTGRYEYISPSMVNVAGYTAEELQAHGIETLTGMIHPDNVSAFRNALALLEKNDNAIAEYRLLTKNGEYRWLSNHMSVTRDDSGKPLYRNGNIRDITAYKIAEEELVLRANELAVTNNELKAFSYSVSHDLRTPLRTMKGFSSLLLQDYADKLDAEGKEILDRIEKGADRMGALIDDLLKLSKYSRQPMNLQENDISSIAGSVVDELRLAEPERKVELFIEQNLKAIVDARLIRVALSNLFGNAWKYTSKKPDAKIEFGIMEMSGEKVFFIRDNGVGFDMTYAHKLLAPFQRLHSEAEFPGTGIGLAIVNRVIQRHGGRIWGEGETDKGATFYFTLLFRKYNAPEVKTGAMDGGESGKTSMVYTVIDGTHGERLRQ